MEEQPNMRTIQGQQQALAKCMNSLVNKLSLFCDCFNLGEDCELMWDDGDMNLMLASDVSKATVEAAFVILRNQAKRAVDLLNSIREYAFNQKLVRSLPPKTEPMGQAEGRQHRGEVIASGDVESVQAYADAQNKKLGYVAFTVHAGKLWQATKQQLDEKHQEELQPENLLKFIKSIDGILAKEIFAIEQVKGTVETLRVGFMDRCNELQGKLGNALTSIESVLQQDRNTRSMFDQNKIERLAKLEEQVAQLIKGPG